MFHLREAAAQWRLVDDRAVDLDLLVYLRKDRSDRDCLKNYMRRQVELMAETNEIGTGSKVHKNDGQPENSNNLQ